MVVGEFLVAIGGDGDNGGSSLVAVVSFEVVEASISGLGCGGPAVVMHQRRLGLAAVVIVGGGCCCFA